MVNWLVEDFEPDNRYDLLIKEIQRQGMKCEVISYIPFESGSYDVFKEDECVVFQGSLQLARQLLREKKWIPNSWLTLQNYECSTYYAHFGEHLFNDNYAMMPVAEITRRFDWCMKTFGKDDSVFIRPSSGFKTFAGQIFTTANFSKDWQWVKEFTEPNQLVVVSSPKIILAEWRFIVVDRQVITGALYRLNGKSSYREINKNYDRDVNAYNKACEIANCEFRPDTVFTVDICQAWDCKYYLLEIGSFNCSGLYSCNLSSIVSSVSSMAEKEWNDYYNI